MTKEEKKKVIDFCKAYIPTRMRIAQAQKAIAMFEKRLNAEGITAFEEKMMVDTIQRKRNVIEEDKKAIILFETAMTDLDGLDLLVFRQLYAEGKQQNEVTDADGRIMPRTSVKRRRDHAIEIIGGFILMFQMDGQSK